MGGQRKYRRPFQRSVAENFGDVPSKIQNMGAYINDQTVTPILYAPLLKREAPLVGNLGG